MYNQSAASAVLLDWRKLTHMQLEQKYSQNFYNCKNNILNNFPNLKDAKHYFFYEAFMDAPFPGLKGHLPRIKDSQKAHCNKSTQTIYLSNWALRSSIDQLSHILLHELLHLNFPQYDENQIIDLTDQYFSKLCRKCSILCLYTN